MNPNQRTLGKYEIIEELGRGAFATVYRALDTTLDREVALKVLHPQLLTDPTFVARFQREARAIANLRHPHIVIVHEVNEAEGRLFIAIELARGSDLGQAIVEQGRIPWDEALALLKPVCEALDYAHGQGVIHRDLKPSNILLDEERGPLLTDFGFARLMGDSSVSLSLSGGILGTPAYIAPEVWELDAAEGPADVYALGCILYEMLTGEVLFAGKTPMQAMRAHDKGPQFPEAWPEGVPEGIVTVLSKSLSRDPAARYPSGAALWYALNDLEADVQMAREAAERATLAAQWRVETEAAMQAGEWSAAKMALGRWLAVAPNDPAVQAARAKIERQFTGQRRPETHQKTPNTTTITADKSPSRAVGEIVWWMLGSGVLLVPIYGIGIIGIVGAIGMLKGRSWGRKVGLAFSILLEIAGLAAAVGIVFDLASGRIGDIAYFADSAAVLIGMSVGIILAYQLGKETFVHGFGERLRRPACAWPIAIPMMLTGLGIIPAVGLLRNKNWGRVAMMTFLCLFALGSIPSAIMIGFNMRVCYGSYGDYHYSDNEWGMAIAVVEAAVITIWCATAFFHLKSRRVKEWFKRDARTLTEGTMP